MATEIVLRLLMLLREMQTVTERRWQASVLLTALEVERHVVGLTMAADLLEDSGFRVLFAGGDRPLSGFASLLDHHVPDLVAFSATMHSGLVTLDPAVRLAQEAGVKGILAGGAAIANGTQPITGLHTIDAVGGVVQAADGLLRRAELD